MRKFILKNKVQILLLLMVAVVLIVVLSGIYGRKYLTKYLDYKTEQKNQTIDTADYYQPEVPAENSVSPAPDNSGSTANTDTSSTSGAVSDSTPGTKLTAPTSPEKSLINIAFMSQAPDANWDELHEDACEEASFLMVKHYLDKTPIGTTSEFDQEIKSMISYEEQNGYGPSITAEQLVKIAKDNYGMTGQVKPATVESIRNDVAAGHPVIVPAAGKLLGNPNFRNGGPNYHMLVIKGYNDLNFITNDPGTRKGNGYVYTKTILMKAIHDFDADNIENGAAVYIVF